MSGSVIGGHKAAQTNRARYGKDFYTKLASQGGRAGTGHKFAHGKVDPSTAGKLGGRPPKQSRQGFPKHASPQEKSWLSNIGLGNFRWRSK